MPKDNVRTARTASSEAMNSIADGRPSPKQKRLLLALFQLWVVCLLFPNLSVGSVLGFATTTAAGSSSVQSNATIQRPYNATSKQVQIISPLGERYLQDAPSPYINRPAPFRGEPNYGNQSWIFGSINVFGAWRKGYTGKTIRIRINDDSWENNHTEWFYDRYIQSDKNADKGYQCGDQNYSSFYKKTTLPNWLNLTEHETYFSKHWNRNTTATDPNNAQNVNYGAAVTSILGADGLNGFCGTGIAINTKLSFCTFREGYTNASVLMHNILTWQLGASHNSYDISVNAFAYQGCTADPYRFKTPGVHFPYDRKPYVVPVTNTTNSTESDASENGKKKKKKKKKKKNKLLLRNLRPEDVIEICPFRNYYDDEYNPGDDPCLVCTESDFDSHRNRRDNIFEFAILQTEKKKGNGKKKRKDKKKNKNTDPHPITPECAASIQAYCRRNFRRDEAVCTEWLEVVNNGNVCSFKSNVGIENSWSLTSGGKEGRLHTGTIYVFAAGDSYGSGDHLAFQAYPKSRYVITVGAVKMVDDGGGGLRPVHASYSTAGSSIFVVAPGGDYDSPYRHYGAGSFDRPPWKGWTCRDLGFGTSYAASVVGGVLALMLEAKLLVPLRGIQKTLIETSRMVEDGDDDSYATNAAGIGYSDLYGFGLIDATAAVNMIENYDFDALKPEFSWTWGSGIIDEDIADDSLNPTRHSIVFDNFDLLDEYVFLDDLEKIESVHVYIKLKYFNRGNLKIELESPSGTVSLLSPGGRNEYGQLQCGEWWEFITHRFWGESILVPDPRKPRSRWKLTITDTKAGDGDAVCIDRHPFEVSNETYKFALEEQLNFTLTCAEYESEGLCANGNHTMDGEKIFFGLDASYNAAYNVLFSQRYGECELTAFEACCACGGGIRPDDEELQSNQLEEWKIVFGDGTPQVETKRASNFNPFLPETSTYEFIRCGKEAFLNLTEHTECCNGLESNCDLRVNETIFPTLHNGMNSWFEGNFVGVFRQYELERALESGYRGFMLDVCNCGGFYEFCFGGVCSEAGKRDIAHVFFYLLEFVRKNPSELIIMFFNLRSDVDQVVDLGEFMFMLLQVRGLIQRTYVHDGPNSTTPWPTLRELITMDKHFLMFQSDGPNCDDTTNEIKLDCNSMFHYTPDWIADNYYLHFSLPEEIEDRDLSCVLQRSYLTNYTNTLVGLENFINPADWNKLARINIYNDTERILKYHAVQDYVTSCKEILQTDINFVADDWWGVGDVPRMTQDYNSKRWWEIQLYWERIEEITWVAPTHSPTDPGQNEWTLSPTDGPTFYPTFSLHTPAPTVSFAPSAEPSNAPTDDDPCPALTGNCKGCKANNEHCLWCVSSSTCYNREVFENIFDLDDAMLPCAGEDIFNSFDTVCTAPVKDMVSVYDDEYRNNDGSNSTDDFLDDSVDDSVSANPSASPTKIDPTPPPTLPPVYVPLSPPTAVEETKNIFERLFNFGRSGASASSLLLSGVAAVVSVLLLLRDV